MKMTKGKFNAIPSQDNMFIDDVTIVENKFTFELSEIVEGRKRI